MRAAVQREYGPPTVVVVVDVERPDPGERQLLVRGPRHDREPDRLRPIATPDAAVHAPVIGVGLQAKARTLGSEFAGVVEQVGAAREPASWSADRVFGYLEGTFGLGIRRVPRGGRGRLGRSPIPDGVSFEVVAAATEGSHYAPLRSARLPAVGPGSDVLVYGATGGIGSAAVQLAKHLGARVTAVCAVPHLALVEGLGPDRVVDYTAEDFLADEQRYDVVLDAVGKRTFGACKVLLKPRGRVPVDGARTALCPRPVPRARVTRSGRASGSGSRSRRTIRR